MTEQPQPTKRCRVCSVDKPLLAFAGRQNTCIQCRDAAKARTQERKEAVAYSATLGARQHTLQATSLTNAGSPQIIVNPTASLVGECGHRRSFIVVGPNDGHAAHHNV